MSLFCEFCNQFPVSSIFLQRSYVIPKISGSETLIFPRTLNPNGSAISSASVNHHSRVLPILRCSTSSVSSVEEEMSPSMRIFIKGLPQSTPEGVLVKAFSRFGKVDRVKIIRDKKLKESLGFAYVWFTSEETAKLAKKEMDGKFFNGRFIAVNIASPESPTSQVRATPFNF